MRAGASRGFGWAVVMDRLLLTLGSEVATLVRADEAAVAGPTGLGMAALALSLWSTYRSVGMID